MAHVTIASDLTGAIFTVDHAGQLHHNRHVYPDGTGPLRHPGHGEPVTVGWDGVQHLTAVRYADQTVLLGVRPDGALVAGGVAGASTGAPTVVTTLGPTRFMFAGASGVLHTVTPAGALHRRSMTLTASARPAVSLGDAEVIEADGWGDGLALFTNGDGIFFDVTVDGILRYQHTRGGNHPTKRGWARLSAGFSRHHAVFAGGVGRIYAIASEGSLTTRRYTTAPDGTVHLSPLEHADTVGSGLFPWAGLAANVEGYAWPLSVTAGESVSLHVGARVSSPPLGAKVPTDGPAAYTVEFRRLRRWKGGKEGDFDTVMPSRMAGQHLTAPRYEVPSDYLNRGADWKESFAHQIPDPGAEDAAHWRSGVYAARLTDASNHSFYASFVVRPKTPQSPFAVLANTNTWNAYNSWGGQGKYTHTYPLPHTLPFRRPHPGLTPDIFWQTEESRFLPLGPSILTNSCHLLRAELWVLGWLEDLGSKYAYDLYTDEDLHAGRTGIGENGAPRYKALILNTHPEYWTREMYDRVRAYRDQGGSIVYLGGNGIYEEVKLSPDHSQMPIFPGVDLAKYPVNVTNEQVRLNCLMRSPAVGRPEHALLGVGFQNCIQGTAEGQPYQLAQDPNTPGANPVLKGLTIAKGATLGATSNDITPPAPNCPSQTYQADGWEVDQRGAGTPPQAFDAAALLAVGNDTSFSGQMLCYRTDQGGLVFSAASLNFGGSLVVDANLQRIVQNALDLCLATDTDAR